MRLFYLVLLFLLLAPAFARAQAISINTDASSPDPSAILDVKSSVKGMLVPRMTTAQRTAIATPATGLLVFDTNTNSFWFFNGTAWTNLAGGGGGASATFIADTDGNTKVQTEKNPNEDIVRFDLAGTESMVLQKNAGGSPRLELPNALNNTFVGTSAGQANTTGVRNTANGRNALFSNTTASDNTANGYQALGLNTTGTDNTATGSFVLFSNTTGINNTATGRLGLNSNTTGSNNTALGYAADVTSGALTNATAIGYNAKVGASNSMVLGGTGANAVSVGVGTTTPNASALLDLTSTNKGMLVPRMTTAQRTAIASPATGLLVFDTTTGGFWFYNGAAWQAISSGGGGIANRIADADDNTKVQVEKNPNEDIIRFDLSGTESMVLRKNAGGSPRLELPNALSNTFVGTDAGQANTTGSNNTANGKFALSSNTTGSSNTAIGFALYLNTSGSYNIAIGEQALGYNTFGNFNTAAGSYALQNNISGSSNTATGLEALLNNTASQNTATGYQALRSNTTGGQNAALGYQALYGNITGTQNVAIGYGALGNGDNCQAVTCVGPNAGVSMGMTSQSTAIGNGATVNASNKIRIGNAAVTVIEGQVAYTFPSDARFKFNIHDDAVPGLAFIEKLRPVTYQFDTRKFDEHLMQNMPDSTRRQRLAGQDYRESSAIVQTGFLAQEVEKACQELNFTFSGLHVPTSAVDNYGLAYGSFVPLLVKGMQEQQAVIEALKAENAAMKAQLDKITTALQTAGIGVGN